MKKRAMLVFTCRGEQFVVNEQGEMIQSSRLKAGEEFSGRWLFLGVSKHHWSRHITVSTKEGFKDPQRLVGGIVWDKDCGTVRTWGGTYLLKLPRITCAEVVEEA